MKHPKVAIIILNWNGLDDTIECLESLKKIAYPDYYVVAVDNGSEGNDAQVLKEKYGNYMHVIRSDKNFGFAGGVNIGIHHVLQNTQPDHILLLNNDTVVDPQFLDELVRMAETDEQIGIVGPKIYYYNYQGKNNVIWFAGGRIRLWHPWIYQHIGKNDNDLPKYQSVANVDWITGAALMFRSCLIDKLGLLNSSYFFGNEDVEYCLKARRLGFKIIYVPSAKVWHKVSASTNKCNPTPADPLPYYQLIKHNFSQIIYFYHLLTLPLLLLYWALIYSIKYPDKKLFRRLFSNFVNITLQRQR
jgi:GT2 family glycosyltransferase